MLVWYYLIKKERPDEKGRGKTKRILQKLLTIIKERQRRTQSAFTLIKRKSTIKPSFHPSARRQNRKYVEWVNLSSCPPLHPTFALERLERVDGVGSLNDKLILTSKGGEDYKILEGYTDQVR